MTYWRSQHFMALQKAWYAKLEDVGFEDAEQLVGEELLLKQNAEHPYKGADSFDIEQKEAYYRVLGERSHAHAFKKETDRIIMVMFSEGARIKAIVEALSNAGTRRCRQAIRDTIRKYEMAWGLREYTPKQLNRYKAPKNKSA